MFRFQLVAFTVVCLSSNLFADVVGDGVTVYNTLIDVQTGGTEFFIAPANAVVSEPGIEFDDYLDLYDVDFTATSAWMGLIGNSPLDGVPLLFPGDPDPRFDTYYYFFDGHDVTNVSLDSSSGDLAEFATVGIVPAGELDFANESFTTNTDGFFIRFGAGTDYTNTLPANPLATVSMNFETRVVPEPNSLGMCVFLVIASMAGQRRRGRQLQEGRG